MSFTSEDYRSLLKSLLPKGKAWTAEPGTDLYNLLWAFADEYANIDTSIDNLLIESDPRTTTELISEWETLVGLPDACNPAGGTLQERRDAVVTRLTETGGLTRQFFINVASGLGYDIAIEEKHPFRLGVSSQMGDVIRDPDFQFVWIVHSPVTSPLECMFNVLKPAHTNVFFELL